MTTRLAILDDYQNVALSMADWDIVRPALAVESIQKPFGDEDEAAGRLSDFEIIVAMRERTAFRRSLLERLPRLKLLVTTGMRNASIDVRAANDGGVLVCGTRSLHYPTAELTWGLILALARKLPLENAGMHGGKWQTTVGVGLQGKVLGILGLGKLGGQVAAVGNAFGMEAIAWSENLTEERASSLAVRRVDKGELFRRSDFLTIHTILSKRTRGLVSGGDLAMMKPTAYLINTSRGPIINEAALLAALQEGQIAGAALDVYDREPLPENHPLRQLNNVILTPHLGYVTLENYQVYYGDALEDVQAYLAGKPVRVIAAS